MFSLVGGAKRPLNKKSGCRGYCTVEGNPLAGTGNQVENGGLRNDAELMDLVGVKRKGRQKEPWFGDIGDETSLAANDFERSSRGKKTGCSPGNCRVGVLSWDWDTPRPERKQHLPVVSGGLSKSFEPEIRGAFLVPSRAPDKSVQPVSTEIQS